MDSAFDSMMQGMHSYIGSHKAMHPESERINAVSMSAIKIAPAYSRLLANAYTNLQLNLRSACIPCIELTIACGCR